jgi:hypothetical protein
MAIPTANRQPRSQEFPARQVKNGGDPDSFDKETIAWQFYRQDRLHLKWGWDKLPAKDWRQILAELKSLEGLTWAKIKEQAGGRKNGTNSHTLEMKDFTKDARDRITDLHLDQFERLFSLRLKNTLRLYGVREGRVLQLVWHDPFHGSSNGCYPTKK